MALNSGATKRNASWWPWKSKFSRDEVGFAYFTGLYDELGCAIHQCDPNLNREWVMSFNCKANNLISLLNLIQKSLWIQIWSGSTWLTCNCNGKRSCNLVFVTFMIETVFLKKKRTQESTCMSEPCCHTIGKHLLHLDWFKCF